MIVFLSCQMIVLILAVAGAMGFNAAARAEERLLCGFEIEEMKPEDGRGTFWKVGKVWEGGTPAPG